MRRLIAVGAVLLVGCGAHQTNPQLAPAATGISPCRVTVPAPDSGTWHQIQGQGFAFCVPADWRASGARGWRGDGGSITWGTGEYRPRTTVGPLTRVPASIRTNPAPPPGTLNVTEVIGGETAHLWESQVQGSEHTGATWETRRIYFEGTSGGPQGAARQFMVYRTVQFAEPRK